MKKVLIVILIVLLCCGTYYWNDSTNASKTQEKTQEIVSVERGPMKVIIESTGSVEPEREIEIKCEASGEIATLPVEVSDVVKKGDLLVQLDPRDEERLVKRAKVSSIVSQAKLEQAKLSLTISRQELVETHSRLNADLLSAEVLSQGSISRLKRIEQLHEKKMVSEEELEEARVTKAKNTANLENIKISIRELENRELQIAMLEHDVLIAEQNVVNNEIDLADAEERLRETTVRSPIDGVVSTCDVQVGQIISSGKTGVNGGTTVLYLSDMSRMYVLVFVDESDIGNIRHGQPVQVTVDAFPDEKFEGEVVRVATKGKSNSNVVTFEVKVEVTGANKFQMKPGMTANVEIVVVDKKDVIRVPVKAVHQNSKQCFVMMATDKTEAVKREITMGETDGDWIEILSGLKDGDKVQVTKQKQSTWRRNTEEDRPMPPGGGMSPGMMNGGGGPPR